MAGAADAATIKVNALDGDAWAAVDMSQSVALPDGAGWVVGQEPQVLPSADYPIDPATAPSLGNEPCLWACSPFYGGSYKTNPTDAGAPGWQTTEFYAVFEPNKPDPEAHADAMLSFGGLQGSLSLLWGSPDIWNLIGFLKDGEWVDFLTGQTLAAAFPGAVTDPGSSAAYVTISGVEFDTVVFRAYGANKGSFEFANVSATPVDPVSPVPLPAGVLLLGTGLGAFALMRRKRA